MTITSRPLKYLFRPRFLLPATLIFVANVALATSPTAVDDQPDSIDEGTQITIDVLANDYDQDGDEVVLHSVTRDPFNGAAEVQGDQILYIPDENFNGTDTFEYYITDGELHHNDGAIVTITVLPLPDPPVAEDDTQTTAADQEITFNVLDNDFEPDGDPLQVVNVSQPDSGTVQWNADGTVTYQFVYPPDPGFGFGDQDTFTYSISDGDGSTANATAAVAVTVNSPADDDVDTDGDGMPDSWEITYGTDPLDPDAPETDRDNDGLTDLYEYYLESDPTDDSDADLAGDADQDGLTNAQEQAEGLRPDIADADGDGVLDGQEQDWDQDTDGDGVINALDNDSDNDALADGDEVNAGLSPVLTDSDGDGYDDSTEGLTTDTDGDGTIDALDDDSDGDRLSDADELAAGTDRTNIDSDGDGFSDGIEDAAGLDPASDDSDNDGYTDDIEGLAVDTDNDGTFDALDTDSDGDGLSDADELQAGTDRTDPDSDDDGFSDGDEVTAGTDPLATDSDGDGLIDDDEIAAGLDPYLADSDGDGYDDSIEGLTADTDDDGTLDALDADSDDDGLSDADELAAGTDRIDPDSDDDGLSDGDEAAAGTDPLAPDSDDDGLNDSEEAAAGSDPLDPDTDDDGITDGNEVQDGTDPSDTDSDADGIADKLEPDWDVDTDGDGSINALDSDSDGDEIPDGVEDSNGDGWIAGDENGNRNMDPGEAWTETDPLNEDTDGDGIVDGKEDTSLDGNLDVGETDPLSIDSDADGIDDGIEDNDHNGMIAGDDGAGDHDGNRIWDADEDWTETDPLNPDTDGDGLSDGEEDTDHDGLIAGDDGDDRDMDPDETWTETDPLNDDSDGDGIKDGTEPQWNSDTDNDGLINALDADSDDDGVPDGGEDSNRDGVIAGDEDGGRDMDPGETWMESDPLNADTDGDGLSDGDEDADGDGAIAGDDGAGDHAGNRIWDVDEDWTETSPLSPDTDGDGISDGIEDANLDGLVAGDDDEDRMIDDGEIWTETDPLNPDTDGDGLSDGAEDADRNGVIAGDDGAEDHAGNRVWDLDETWTETDPLNADTDDDGEDTDNDGILDVNTDRLEVEHGINPLDSLSSLKPGFLRFADGTGTATAQGFIESEPDWSTRYALDAWTVESWVRLDELPSAAGDGDVVLAEYKLFTAGQVNYAIGINTDDRPVAYFDAEAGTAVTVSVQSAQAMGTGDWTHIAASFDGSRLTLYVDGQVAGMTGTGLACATGDGQFIMGENLNGDLDEVRVWNSARTQSEIQGQKDNFLMFIPEGEIAALRGEMQVVPPMNSTKELLTEGTLEAWVKLPPGQGECVFVGYGPPGDNGQEPKYNYSLGVNDNGRLVGEGGGTVLGISDLRDNQWHHVAYSFDADRAVCYLDGTRESLVAGSTPSSQVGNTVIGRHVTGLVDEVRIWNATQSEADIELHQSAFLIGDEEGLANYFNFDYNYLPDASFMLNGGYVDDTDNAPVALKDFLVAYFPFDDRGRSAEDLTHRHASNFFAQFAGDVSFVHALDEGTYAWDSPVASDGDLDGMADWWEKRYMLESVSGEAGLDPDADPDYDGLSNETEYLLDKLAHEQGKIAAPNDLRSRPDRYDTDGDGNSDGQGDFDNDNLTNADEESEGTDARVEDTDGDSLVDGDEVAAGLDPTCEDSDDDGYTDGIEGLAADTDGDGTLDALDADSDGDGVSDADELTAGTDRIDTDSDDDGLSDGDEVAAGTDPLEMDSDGDGLSDGDEVAAGLDPLNADSDNDGYSDDLEGLAADTDGDGTLDALDADSDNDGLNDADELTAGTDRIDTDSDDDGLSDGDEVAAGLDPASDDSDSDGYTDDVEGLAVDTDGDGTIDALDTDSDNDGLNDAEEFVLGTDRINADSDSDGMDDAQEAASGTDPLDPDTDADGWTDGVDAEPLIPDRDTDDDTEKNVDEVALGFDPFDSLSKSDLRNLVLTNPGNSAADDYAEIDYSGKYALTEFTVMAWVKTSDPDGIVVSRRTAGGAANYELAVVGGLATIRFDGSTGHTLTGGVVDDGTWHHLAAVLDPDFLDFRFYVDGTLAGSKMVVDSPETGNGDIRITNGWSGTGDELLTGSVDEVRIYDRVLEEDDIATIAEAGSLIPLTGTELGLVAGFRFDDDGVAAEDFTERLDWNYAALIFGDAEIADYGNEWDFGIALSGAEVAGVAVGMDQAATDDFDAGLDASAPGDSPVPPGGQTKSTAVFVTADGEEVVRDLHAPGSIAPWFLQIDVPDGGQCTLSWNMNMYPAANLMLTRVDAAGDPVLDAGDPEFQVYMSELGTHTVSAQGADATFYFEIEYIEIFYLRLDSGWNLISVPIQPADGDVDTLLEGQHTGEVWEWAAGSYSDAVNLEPGKGYWVYRIGSSVVITVHGTVAAASVVSLTEDWNMTGPILEAPYDPIQLPFSPAVGAVIYPVYGYDPVSETYYDAGQLEAGFGYWMLLDSDIDVDLGN